MRYIKLPLSREEINSFGKEFGNYFKVTADIKKKELVAGCELHVDGEELLLKNGSRSADIWGGGINLETKLIDTTAVLNLRPRLGNPSLEVLDPARRDKFLSLVKKLFDELWH